MTIFSFVIVCLYGIGLFDAWYGSVWGFGKILAVQFVLTLKHYNFEVAGLGWDSFFNSVRMSLYAAFFGTIIIFIGSYLIEKMRR